VDSLTYSLGATVASWNPSHSRNGKSNHHFLSSHGGRLFDPLPPSPRMFGPLLTLLAKYARNLTTLSNIVDIGMTNLLLQLFMPTSLNCPFMTLPPTLPLF